MNWLNHCPDKCQNINNKLEKFSIKVALNQMLHQMLNYVLVVNQKYVFCCAHDKAVHIFYKPLPLSIWMKQLPPYTIGCKTQIALIFWNIFKAASLSCYITVTMKILELLRKQPLYLIKIFPKSHNHLNKLLHRIVEPNWHIPCGENMLLKILCSTAGNNDLLNT